MISIVTNFTKLLFYKFYKFYVFIFVLSDEEMIIIEEYVCLSLKELKKGVKISVEFYKYANNKIKKRN